MSHLPAQQTQVTEGVPDQEARFSSGGIATNTETAIEAPGLPARGFSPGGPGGSFGFDPATEQVVFHPTGFASLLDGESVSVGLSWTVSGRDDTEFAGVTVQGTTGNETEPPPPTTPPPPADPATLIDFNDPASLAALSNAARFETVVAPERYTEDGMTFTAGVDPPDPALGGEGLGGYRLAYEDPSDRVIASRSDAFAAEMEPRSLQSFGGPHVIQLTHEAGDGDPAPDPFNLLSIDVVSGTLNVGVRDVFGNISVYNNLTGGFRWHLNDATNLDRVTLEGTGSIYTVDNIRFEPALVPFIEPIATPESLPDSLLG